MRYGKLNGRIIKELAGIVGEGHVWTSEEKLESCSRDETTTLRKTSFLPGVVIAPSCAAEAAAVMKLANKYVIPVTPRGGGTGLSGGALPVFGGIVMTDERMNRILEIDCKNLAAVVEPGVVTADINAAAAEKGLWYAGYPMSVESCHIGGNIAENAGGGNAIKYSVTMRYVLGLEVVTPIGEILHLGGKLMKNVSGYSLKELFIGSEGTLGYVTKITLKLQPMAKDRVVVLALFPDTETAIDTVPRIMTEGRLVPASVEYIDGYCYKKSCARINEGLPVEGVGAALLIETDSQSEQSAELEAERAGTICEKCGAIEVYIADSATSRERIWAVRRGIDEALRATDPIQTDEDTVVPVSEITSFARGIAEIERRHGVKIANFGHAGDGNLHPTILKKRGMPIGEWEKLEKKIEYELFELTYSLGGVISGEHGIGSKRKDFFKMFCAPEEISVMRAIKKALDPKNIMNPGKIFDLQETEPGGDPQ